jgi:phage FluMu protein Com
VNCGNVLAASMDAAYMTKRVRVKCGRCKTINVAVTDESEPRRPRGSGHG